MKDGVLSPDGFKRRMRHEEPHFRYRCSAASFCSRFASQGEQ
jgi:hypothetical protein